LINTKNFQSGETSRYFTYGTLVWFFTRMPSHMHDQHVLSLEGFFLPRAFLPTANKALLVGVYVIVVDMFHEIILVWGEIHVRLMWIRPSLSLRYTDS